MEDVQSYAAITKTVDNAIESIRIADFIVCRSGAEAGDVAITALCKRTVEMGRIVQMLGEHILERTGYPNTPTESQVVMDLDTACGQGRR